jgi:hypothetical protein
MFFANKKRNYESKLKTNNRPPLLVPGVGSFSNADIFVF